MAGNSNLASAMEAKQDEFYTQLRTIEYAASQIEHLVYDIVELSLLFIGHGVSPIIRVSLQYVIMEQLFVLMGRSGLVP